MGAGSSERWMASAEASSIRRESNVETEWRAKPQMRRRIRKKTRRERRIVVVVELTPASRCGKEIV